MSMHPWPHLVKRLKKGQVLLGLDVGEKTIGIAICDPAFKIATPLTTIERRKVTVDMAALAKLAKERGVGGFVIGLPLHMDGRESKMSEKIRVFAKQMLEAREVFGTEPELSLWDERLSTETATRFLIDDVDLSRKRRDEIIDKMAAQIILQTALDRLHA
jgi:putative Holliday junction resolvase